jgi:hypothetical protein
MQIVRNLTHLIDCVRDARFRGLVIQTAPEVFGLISGFSDCLAYILYDLRIATIPDISRLWRGIW